VGTASVFTEMSWRMHRIFTMFKLPLSKPEICSVPTFFWGNSGNSEYRPPAQDKLIPEKRYHSVHGVTHSKHQLATFELNPKLITHFWSLNSKPSPWRVIFSTFHGTHDNLNDNIVNRSLKFVWLELKYQHNKTIWMQSQYKSNVENKYLHNH
jgi:hypothetical protein